MTIQLVILAKPELFETPQILDRYHEFFRELRSYNFPDGIDIGLTTLMNISKQIFIASMLQEIGDNFFGGTAPMEAEFFDRWWLMKSADDVNAAELADCDNAPAVRRIERLKRSTREKLLSMQPVGAQKELQKLLAHDDRPQGTAVGGLLYEATDYFKPFPDPETVFADDVETHSKYLLPLATVSLEHINPEWSGPIHFVQPIEPHDGVVGGDTPSHHGPLCAENWIGYRIDEQGRYTLATEWDYFLLHNLDNRTDIQPDPASKQQLREHYEKAKRSYVANRAHFNQFGGLHPSYSWEAFGFWRDRDRHELVMQLGGTPGWGNWPEIGDWPLSEYEDEEDPDETYPIPQADDGTDFSYIGWMHSFVYVDTSPCDLQLFYHPELRLALTTFDWS